MAERPSSSRRWLSVLVEREDGSYETPVFVRSLADGTSIEHHSTVSAEGYRQIRYNAALEESMRETFDALEPFLGRCEHGMDIGDLIDEGTLRWQVNTYVCNPYAGDENVVWMLWGMHPGGDWCFPYDYFRGVVSPHDESNWSNPLLELDVEAWNIVEVSA